MKKILELKNVKVNFKVEDDIVKAVGGVSFDVYENEILCIIGETGCGKSVLGASILKILPKNAFVQGKIIYNGEDILEMSDREYIKLRGKEIAVVPQSPVMSLDPLMRVGKQIYEAYRVVDKTEKKEDIYKKIKSLLKRLDLPVERNIEKNYPCELSGGMNQRVLIFYLLIGKDHVFGCKGITVLKFDVLLQGEGILQSIVTDGPVLRQITYIFPFGIHLGQGIIGKGVAIGHPSFDRIQTAGKYGIPHEDGYPLRRILLFLVAAGKHA